MGSRQWWRSQWDRVLGWGLVALGALALLVGWAKVADTPYPAEQLPLIISGGIGGALLVVLGAALLLSADARDEWTKLDRIERILLGRSPDGTDADADADPPPVVKAVEPDVEAVDPGPAPGAPAASNGAGRRRRPARAGEAPGS